MTAVIRPLTASPAWKSLEAHHQKIRELHLRELFSDDPKRGERMTVEAVGIYLDYSKNRITEETHRVKNQGSGDAAAGDHDADQCPDLDLHTHNATPLVHGVSCCLRVRTLRSDETDQPTGVIAGATASLAA